MVKGVTFMQSGNCTNKHATLQHVRRKKTKRKFGMQHYYHLYSSWAVGMKNSLIYFLTRDLKINLFTDLLFILRHVKKFPVSHRHSQKAFSCLFYLD